MIFFSIIITHSHTIECDNNDEFSQMALTHGCMKRPTNNSNFPSSATKDHNHLNPSSPEQGILSFTLLEGFLCISHFITVSPMAFFHCRLLQGHIDLGKLLYNQDNVILEGG